MVRFRLMLLFMVAVAGGLLLPPADAAAPDEGCIAYAYTADTLSNHYSLIRNGSLLVGGLIVAHSDCGPYELHLDGSPVQSGEGGVLSVTAPLSTRSVSMVGDGWRMDWHNLSFMAGSDFVAALAAGADEPTENALWFTPAEIQSREVWVAVGTGLILWVLVVAILSRAVNWWMESHFIEEVIS